MVNDYQWEKLSSAVSNLVGSGPLQERLAAAREVLGERQANRLGSLECAQCHRVADGTTPIEERWLVFSGGDGSMDVFCPDCAERAAISCLLRRRRKVRIKSGWVDSCCHLRAIVLTKKWLIYA